MLQSIRSECGYYYCAFAQETSWECAAKQQPPVLHTPMVRASPFASAWRHTEAIRSTRASFLAVLYVMCVRVCAICVLSISPVSEEDEEEDGSTMAASETQIIYSVCHHHHHLDRISAVHRHKNGMRHDLPACGCGQRNVHSKHGSRVFIERMRPIWFSEYTIHSRARVPQRWFVCVGWPNWMAVSWG